MKNFERFYDEAEPVKDESRCRLVQVNTLDGKDAGYSKAVTDKYPFDEIKSIREEEGRN